jgi:hypothetical protein
MYLSAIQDKRRTLKRLPTLSVVDGLPNKETKLYKVDKIDFDIRERGRFHDEILSKLPITTYKEWQDIPTGVHPSYTIHNINGSILFTREQKIAMLIMIKVKTIWMLNRYKVFVHPTSTVEVMTESKVVRNLDEDKCAFAHKGNIYINPFYLFRTSDVELFDTITHEIAHIIRDKWDIRLRPVASERGRFFPAPMDSHDAYWVLIHLQMGGTGQEFAYTRTFNPLYDEVENSDLVVFICTGPNGRGGCCYKRKIYALDEARHIKDQLESAEVTEQGRIITHKYKCIEHQNDYEVIIPEYEYVASASSDTMKDVAMNFIKSRIEMVNRRVLGTDSLTTGWYGKGI